MAHFGDIFTPLTASRPHLSGREIVKKAGGGRHAAVRAGRGPAARPGRGEA